MSSRVSSFCLIVKALNIVCFYRCYIVVVVVVIIIVLFFIRLKNTVILRYKVGDKTSQLRVTKVYEIEIKIKI